MRRREEVTTSVELIYLNISRNKNNMYHVEVLRQASLPNIKKKVSEKLHMTPTRLPSVFRSLDVMFSCVTYIYICKSLGATELRQPVHYGVFAFVFTCTICRYDTVTFVFHCTLCLFETFCL